MTRPLSPQLAALYAKRPQVIKPGLARIEAALDRLGPGPLLATPSVLIGGTNGKGTTAGFLWQMLATLGVRSGLFTSPHLVDFAERIRLTHEDVDEAALLAELEALRRELPPALYEPLSFFEVNTLLALRLFRRFGTEVDVLEVGLGGRWDSTNVAKPILSVITSIGLDHQEFLGATTTEIAFEKAGIMRPGVPVLWGGPTAGDSEAQKTLYCEAAARAAPLWELGREFGANASEAWVRLPGQDSVSAALPRAWVGWPRFLRDNWLKAFAALVYLLQTPALAAARARLEQERPRGNAEAAPAAAVAALSAGQAPVPPCLHGRFERVTATGPDGRSRRLLLDVCHNVDGARALVGGLAETGLLAAAGGSLPGLVSILGDKDCDGILDVLRPVLRPLTLFAVDSERSWTVGRLAPRHRDLAFYPTFEQAFVAAPLAAEPAVICGSVYAVGEVCAALGLAPLDAKKS